MTEYIVPYIHQNKIYPHLLLDLDSEEIKNIIYNSFIFVAQRLEVDAMEHLREIESYSKDASQTTIYDAVNEAEDFMDDIMNTFEIKFDPVNFEKRRHNMKKGYMAVFNQPELLIFVRFKDGKDGVVSQPLIEALWETCSVIFDGSITKSPEMKYKISKSDNPDRKMIRSIDDKRRLRYHFVKVLKKYGANERQIIKNFDVAFGQNLKNATKSMAKLPKIFRK